MSAESLINEASGSYPKSLLTGTGSAPRFGVNKWLSEHAIIDYLTEEEIPEYAVFHNKPVIIKNHREITKSPDDGFQSILVATQSRLIIAIGRICNDEGFSIEYNSIKNIFVKNEGNLLLPIRIEIVLSNKQVSFPVINGMKDQVPKLINYVKEKSDIPLSAPSYRVGLTKSGNNISDQKLQNDSEWLNCSPTEFEHKIAQVWKYSGYDVDVTSPNHDRGVDVIAARDGNRILIQAKQYDPHKNNKVGIATVQRTAGLLADPQMDADRVVVVTSSMFTDSAIERANQIHPLSLIDGRGLRYLSND
jgi:HJR/Mrr/RecB family endonuclease